MNVTTWIAGILVAASLSYMEPEYPVREFIEPQLIRTTCYTSYGDNAKTADGSEPREGIVAGRKEDIGKSVIMYSVTEDGGVGEIIGYFEIKDCGGHPGLKNGTRIDVYRDSKERCKEFTEEFGDHTYVQIIDAF